MMSLFEDELVSNKSNETIFLTKEERRRESQRAYREKNKEYLRAFEKAKRDSRREERNGKKKAFYTSSIKKEKNQAYREKEKDKPLISPKIWEANYRHLFEKTYGKI